MTRTNELHIRAPFTGMEEREAFQGHTSCSLAVNVDFSRGDIRPRPGFRKIEFANNRPSMAELGILETNGQTYIARCGTEAGHTNSAGEDAHFQAVTLEGSITASVNLTTLFGETPRAKFQCTILNSILDQKDVMLVFTPDSCYVYDPATDETTVRRLSTTADAIKLNSSNGLYWKTVPCGPFATQKDTAFYFGGWDSKSVLLTGDLPTGQDDVPENVVGVDRSEMVMNKSMMAFSDGMDPAGVWAPNWLIYGLGERYMGSVVLGEVQYAFTDQAIYARTGADVLEALRVNEVSRGHGCVAGKSIVQAGNTVYYLSHDGVYAFNGAEPVKISQPIDSLFTGFPEANSLPAEVNTALDSCGYPWPLKRNLMDMAVSAWLPDLEQLWMTLPCLGGWVTAVFSAAVGAWAIYTSDSQLPLMGDHVHYRGRNYFTAPDGVYVLGEGSYDFGSSGYPVVYLSRRYGLESISMKDWQRLWVDIYTCGKTEDYSEVPEFFLLGSQAALDSEDGGADNTDRQEQDVSFLGHPEHEQNTYWYNTAVYNTAQWTQNGWAWMEMRPENVRDRWIQFGFVDYPSSDDRPAVTRIRGFCLESNEVGRR